MLPIVAMNSVWPSGSDFAAISVPIVPLAPARFSTTTPCPHASWSLAPTTLATMSVPPPGRKATMIFTGLGGNASAAFTQRARSRERHFMWGLLRLNADVARYLDPLRELGGDEAAELRRRHAHRLRALGLHALAGLLRLQHFAHRAIEAVQHRRRRACRGEHAPPVLRLVAGQRLGDRRHAGQLRAAYRAARAERLQPAALDVRYDLDQRRHDDL